MKIKNLSFLLFWIGLGIGGLPLGHSTSAEMGDQKQEEAVLTTDSVIEKASGPSWFTSSADTRHKWAIFPNYERNTTYGHIFGARVFAYPVEDTGYYTALQASVSEEFFWDTAFSYKYWKKNGDQFDLIAFYNGFSEAYYGEGMDTQPSDREDIPIHKGHLRLEYVYRVIDFLYGGLFFQFDYRAEKAQTKKFPDELVASMGGLIRYDSRDNIFNPQRGEYYQARVWLNSRLTSPLFLDGEVRLFFPVVKKVVVALRGMAGITLLNPSSHLFRFSLGGPYLLRGYTLNRFRGENYWLSQLELRHTPWKWLTLTGFFDIGSIWDESPLPPPRYGFGGSLRLGLPPDYNKKIRIEIGKGGEKYNFTISFNHPF